MEMRKKEVDVINLRYKKILRSMVFGNFAASLEGKVNLTVVDQGEVKDIFLGG